MGWIECRPALRSFYLVMGVAGAALAFDAASAQTPPAKPEPPAKKWAPSVDPRPATPAQPQVAIPDSDKIILLVRSTLLTLNDALQTGNFTVLRDVGAPSFHEANTAGRLAQIFAPLASLGVDLTAVTILAPQLTEVPTIDPQRQILRLKGFFPGQPLQINFEILYEPIASRWHLFGLSVNAVAPDPATAAPVVATPPAKVPPGPTGKAK